MADVLKILLLIVGYILIYLSYWLVAQALFPAAVQRAREQYAHPLRATLVGLAISAPLILIGAIILKMPNPVMKIIGGIIAGVPVIIGLAGSAGLCQRIGQGLPSPLDVTQPWRQVLRGGIVLTLTYLLPFVGWFVIPIWVLISGCGAMTLAWRDKSARSTPAAPSPVLTEMQPASEHA